LSQLLLLSLLVTTLPLTARSVSPTHYLTGSHTDGKGNVLYLFGQGPFYGEVDYVNSGHYVGELPITIALGYEKNATSTNYYVPYESGGREGYWQAGYEALFFGKFDITSDMPVISSTDSPYAEIDQEGNYAIHGTFTRAQFDFVTSDGTASTEKLVQSFSSPGEGHSTNVIEYVGNSVAKHNRDFMTNVLNSVDEYDISKMEIFSYADEDSMTFTRNTNMLFDLDLTWYSPWNSTGSGSHEASRGLPKGRFRPAYAITRKHLLAADHFDPYVPGGANQIAFVDNTNGVHIREIIDIEHGPYYPDLYDTWGDTCLLRLDEDLPASIHPVKCLPEDWAEYLPHKGSGMIPLHSNAEHTLQPSVSSSFGTTILNQDGELHRGVTVDGELVGRPWSADGYYSYYTTHQFSSPEAVRVGGDGNITWDGAKFRPYATQDGDSGHPIFYIVNNEIVFGGQFFGVGGGAGFCTWIQSFQDHITNVWGDSHMIERIDLSGFEKYMPYWNSSATRYHWFNEWYEYERHPIDEEYPPDTPERAHFDQAMNTWSNSPALQGAFNKDTFRPNGVYRQ